MFKKSLIVLVGLLLVTNIVTACGNEVGQTSGESSSADSRHKPVTLTFGNNQGGYDEAMFNEFVKKPVEAKFPYITMQYADTAKGKDLEKMITAGVAPDIINGGMRGMVLLKDLNLAQDLGPYIKKYNLRMDSYREAGVASIKDYSDKGQDMLALPYLISFYALIYNKDIFDKFAVAYPKDNMTWEDVRELAKKLTRQADGIQYMGVQPGKVTLMARGQSLSFVDPATNRAAVNNDKWKNLFEFASSLYKIPGNTPKDKKDLYNVDMFYKEKVLAMFPYYSTAITTLASTDNVGFNWDLTSYPTFEPGKSAEIDTTIMAVSSTSKYKDEAFQVIQFLTTSPEIQSDIAKNAQMPALKLDNFESIYGSNYPILKQKNIKGVFKADTRIPHPFNKYDDIVRGKVDSIFGNQYLTGAIDVNTALRQIEEQANKAIEQDSAQDK